MFIRSATIDDLPSIQRLNHDLFLSDNEWNHDLDCEWPYSQEGADYFREAIESAQYISIVAEDDGAIVGYLNGYIKKPNSAYLGKRAEIDNMCVDKDIRSRGVGAALIDEFKAWAKKQGVERIIVEAFSANERAIGFYERNGFTPYATVLSEELGDE